VETYPGWTPWIGRIRRRVSGYAEHLGADEESVIDIAIAMGEALSRVVYDTDDGAALNGHRPRVIVVAEPRPGDRLQVVVRGDWQPFTARNGGFGPGAGLALLARTTEQVEVRADAEGPSEMRLTFRLHHR
jgi:hypothetical protein